MKRFEVKGELLTITEIGEKGEADVNRGRNHVVFYLKLLPSGEYNLLFADGFEDYVHRTLCYKSALRRISLKMHDLYRKQLYLYTSPHLFCDKLPTRESVIQKIKSIPLKKYEPVPFDKPQPTVAECEALLETEAKQLYNTWWKRNKPLRAQYVKENLDKLFAQKVEEWNNLASLHNAVEEKNAKEKNAVFQSEYEAAILPDEQFLNGPTDYVYNKLQMIFSKDNSVSAVDEQEKRLPSNHVGFIPVNDFCVPFDSDVDYSEEGGRFMVKIILPETFEKPNYNVSIDDKGKLEMKPKTQQEKDADFNQFLASLPFHIAYLMFTTTVNARMVDVSIVTNDEKAGYLYVRFYREQVVSFNYKELYPLKEIACNLPSVISLTDNKMIATIPIKDFNQQTKTIETEKKNEYESMFNDGWSSYEQQELLKQRNDIKVVDDSDDAIIEVPDIDLTKRDPMFEEAARIIVINQLGSTSLIQRKFSIGYNRAGRIMDQLEAARIVGPFLGAKARDVLIPDEASLDKLLETIR